MKVKVNVKEPESQNESYKETLKADGSAPIGIGTGEITWTIHSSDSKWEANSLADLIASYDGSLKSVGQRIFLKGNILFPSFLQILSFKSS